MREAQPRSGTSRSRWRLSVGTRWTLIYTAVLAVAMSIPTAYVWISVDRLSRQEAALFLDVYLAEIRDEIRESPGEVETVASRLSGGSHLSRSLDVGIAVYDETGALRARSGALARSAAPPPPSPKSAGAKPTLMELGGPAPYLVARTPVVGGSAVVALSLASFARRAERIQELLEFSVPLALLLAALGGGWLARRSLRPVARITRIAGEITAASLDERIPVTGTGDELDRLAETLNRMIERIRTGVERLSRLSALSAHQLRSPVSHLRNKLEVTLDGERLDAHTRDLLGDLLGDVVGLASTIDGMLRLTRSEAGLVPGQATEVDLAGLLEGVIALFDPVAQERGVALSVHAGAASRVYGDVAWLQQLFANLLENAIEFTPAGGSISLRSWDRGAETAVEIADTGPGIEPEELERIFEPFYHSGRRACGEGVGLGLPLAAEIAKAHGGRIDVESTPGAGSRFRVWLPRLFRPSPPRGSPPQESASAGHPRAEPAPASGASQARRSGSASVARTISSSSAALVGLSRMGVSSSWSTRSSSSRSQLASRTPASARRRRRSQRRSSSPLMPGSRSFAITRSMRRTSHSASAVDALRTDTTWKPPWRRIHAHSSPAIGSSSTTRMLARPARAVASSAVWLIPAVAARV